jgi:hypothetical protein
LISKGELDMEKMTDVLFKYNILYILYSKLFLYSKDVEQIRKKYHN